MTVRTSGGYTLVELLIVVSLLSLIAAVAVPALQNSDEPALDRSVREIVRAIRFARNEAIRSGQSHAVVVKQPEQAVQVYRLDETVTPAVAHFDVYDPQTKQLFVLQLGAGVLDVAISDVYFKFDGVTPASGIVEFSGTIGIPRLENSGQHRMLEDGYITLQKNAQTATLIVSPMTGRVTIQ